MKGETLFRNRSGWRRGSSVVGAWAFGAGPGSEGRPLVPTHVRRRAELLRAVPAYCSPAPCTPSPAPLCRERPFPRHVSARLAAPVEPTRRAGRRHPSGGARCAGRTRGGQPAAGGAEGARPALPSPQVSHCSWAPPPARPGEPWLARARGSWRACALASNRTRVLVQTPPAPGAG